MVTPGAQLAPQYGGNASFRQALMEALEQAKANTRNIDALDPEYRRMFPEVDYDNYGEPMRVMPDDAMLGEDAGMLRMPDETSRFPGSPDDMPLDGPQIQFDLVMPGVADDLEMQGFPPDSEIGARARRQMGVEEPMSQMLFDQGMETDPLRRTDLTMQSELGRQQGLANELTGGELPFDSQYATPEGLDSTLAALRRADGRTDLSLEDATRMIQEAADRGANALEVGPSGQMSLGGMVDPQTGTLIEQLLALNYLPDNVKRNLPARLRELLSLGGAGAGMATGQGGGIDPQSTMGPDVLGGLRQ
jgi:hypothetical protein